MGWLEQWRQHVGRNPINTTQSAETVNTSTTISWEVKMADQKTSKTITELYEELESAQAELEDRSQEESYASGRTTTALNRLNNAQKALDEFVGTLKRAASYKSDWKRHDTQGGAK